ncbi:hypothetical protein TthAA220_04500 [Thermus thermophilus]|nr:hypothetical protein TthAA220_04500 [Thermus thermophilus]
MKALRGKPLHFPEEKGLLREGLRQEAGHLRPRGHPDLPRPQGEKAGEDASRGQDFHQDQGTPGRPQAQVNPAHPAMIP